MTDFCFKCFYYTYLTHSILIKLAMQTILNYFENNKNIEYVLMFVISKQKENYHLRTIVQCKRGWDFTIIHILTYLLMLCVVIFLN